MFTKKDTTLTSIARIFGSDFAMVFVNPKETISTHIYEVSRINMTELDSEKSKCSNEVDDLDDN